MVQVLLYEIEYETAVEKKTWDSTLEQNSLCNSLFDADQTNQTDRQHTSLEDGVELALAGARVASVGGVTEAARAARYV